MQILEYDSAVDKAPLAEWSSPVFNQLPTQQTIKISQNDEHQQELSYNVAREQTQKMQNKTSH